MRVLPLLVLTNRAHEAPPELRVDAIGGVILIDAPETLSSAVTTKLEDHLAQADGGTRPVVVDLSGTETVDDTAVAVLRDAWKSHGDRLRVVAAPGSQPARALKEAGLRRFAIHASLSGALTQAAG